MTAVIIRKHLYIFNCSCFEKMLYSLKRAQTFIWQCAHDYKAKRANVSWSENVNYITKKQFLFAAGLEQLQSASWKQCGVHGFLVGRRDDSTLETVFPAYCSSCDVKHVSGKASQLQQLLPGGFELCGLILVTDTVPGPDTTLSAAQKYVINKFEDYLGQESLLICHIKKGSSKIGASNFLLLEPDEEITQCDVQIASDNVISNSVIFRLTAHVPITLYMDTKTNWNQAVCYAMSRVSRSLSSSACVYKVQNSNVLLTSDEVKGVSGDESCDVLYQYAVIDDGSMKTRRKAAKEQLPIGVDMLMLLSGDQTSNCDVPTFSPVIQHNIGDYKASSMMLPVDVVAVVKNDEIIDNVHATLTKAVKHQLDAIKTCLGQCRQMVKYVGHITLQDERLDSPEVFHFRPGEGQIFVSVVYPQSVSDTQLESEREELHTLLMLPMDRPYFRRANKYRFPGETTSEGYLLNPHASLSPAGAVGIQYLVQGTYSYHHYMQDRFDDNKWGCAYRSLQTLASWFRFQGYSDKPVPTHREIQQALVDIGDKQKSFVGSRQWIGSLEVGYCLDQLIGVTCKILNVSSGADLASKGRELASHFQTQGTPIMIGGGVLAHTILGVDFDDVTGNIRFLILDPHYTGSEDLKVVLDKGWCGWKGPDFWDAKAHYNLCMPQRPKVK